MTVKKSTKSKKGKTQPTDKPAFLSSARKLEILGTVLMAISVLLGLSIITHKSGDYAIISSAGFSELIQFDSGPALRIQNGLGPLGAYLAYVYVDLLFGYASIIIAGFGMVFGWKIFRHSSLKPLLPWAFYYLSLMLLISSIFGWFHIEQEMLTSSWSGSVGVAISQFLLSFTGRFGPIIILGSLSLIALLFLIDRDIQATIDRVKEWKSKRKKDKPETEPIPESASSGSDQAPRKKQKVTAAHPPEAVEGDTQGDYQEEESIDDIISRSQQDEENRVRKQREEEQELENKPPRAILDKSEEKETSANNKNTDKVKGSEDELDFSVYVGKKEEEVNEQTIRKEHKSKSADKPVIKYMFPGLNLLDAPTEEEDNVDFDEINENKALILEKLKTHGIEITGIEAVVGPTVTLYELQPAPNVKISKIESYANDLKMAMATQRLRIIAPIPGKSKVGIEVPNRNPKTVYIKSLLKTRKFVETKYRLPVAFGRTIENEVFLVDLSSLPHLLIAGATGSGKSVGINTIITSLLYKCHPEDLKFVLIDPKKIELTPYQHIEEHYLARIPGEQEPIITDTEKVLDTLNSVCKEMDHRYDLLKLAKVRDIKAYNQKYKQGTLDEEQGHRHLPYIVVIIDELADLMVTAGKSIEEPIARIAQLARAVGIHMVLATQRPSVNVITGVIKANFSSRVAYRVATKVDSRTILDSMGAEQLIGRGDMLFSGGTGTVRLQNAFVSTEEVERITNFISEQKGYDQPYGLPLPDDAEESGGGDLKERDPLFEKAARLVVENQKGSVSLVQRRLKLGYNRAGRIVDQLYAARIVGQSKGSAAREVLVSDEFELNQLLEQLDE